jgi:Na+:H+ antiporter
MIPLFFASIGLASDFHALGGHWLLLGAVFLIAMVTKLLGCGLAAMVSGMGFVPSLRVGCGMISRGEVGLIVTAMGAQSGIFQAPEVAVLVAVVLLTTLITPLLRATFRLHCAQDVADAEDDAIITYLDNGGTLSALGARVEEPE